MRRALVVLLLLAVGLLAAGCGEDEDGGGGAAAPFERIPWVLVSGVDVEGWEGVAPSATFAGATVSGSTGCNRYTAPFTVEGDALELGAIASTQMACDGPADAVERAYVAALDRVTGWRVEGEELLLVDADGAELLRYATATPVGSWQATGLLQGNAFASPIAGTEITATFADDGSLSGSSGCNTYTSEYTSTEGAIEIGPAAATRKACAAPAGVMEQEAAYLAMLPTAVSFQVDGPSLELLSADGTRIASYVRTGS